MANPEWGTKRQCPKCGTRFYDLGNFEPIVCIDCDHKFKPEIILKSKMTPLEMVSDDQEDDKEDDDLDVLEDDDDVEIDADDNTVVLSDDDDTNVADVVVKPTPKSGDE
ncbi:FYDLN acid domain-containing protein [Paremcibacter congregatus]|uniref:TIGR02300 family protein n=1 Tax=Paremcibacter congregatus TaxID=2043170 RepID=A0A2G4YNX4_9PROT|nr:FYDLN acid domain-containing protein [Paremcibacter congregatus]PHZ84003.1 TIGR02300 family protein [Paremcibacter congregatus]QDE25969.1 TIGR02300 family protein [Paremcibacter congregatus]